MILKNLFNCRHVLSLITSQKVQVKKNPYKLTLGHNLSKRVEREEWDSLIWDHVMEQLSSTKRPHHSILEITFRKLAYCQNRPKTEIMYKDLNFLSRIVKFNKAAYDWDAKEFVNVFNSCSRLGFIDSELFRLMCQQIMKKKLVDEFGHVELASMIRALGGLGRYAVLNNQAGACGVFFGISELVLRMMNTIVKPEMLMAFTEIQLAEIWKGLCRLRFYDLDYLRSLSIETSKQNRLIYFNEESIATIIKSAAILNYKERRFRRVLLDECTQIHRLKAYSEDDIVTIMHGLGLWDMRDDKTLLKLEEEIIKSHRISEFTDHGLAIIVTAWGILKWFNHEALIKMADEISRPQRIQAMTDQGLNYMAKQFGLLKRDRDLKSLRETVLYCIKPKRVFMFYNKL